MPELSSGEDNEDNERTTGPIVVDEVVRALNPHIRDDSEGMLAFAEGLDRVEFSATTRRKQTIAASLARELRGEAKALRALPGNRQKRRAFEDKTGQ
jgi:hypothetical protein